MIELFIRCIDARFVHCNKAIKCGGQRTSRGSRPHFKEEDLWLSMQTREKTRAKKHVQFLHHCVFSP